MAQTVSDDVLPPFGVRGLSGHDNPPAIIRMTALEYDASIKEERRSTLTYLDEDDGETVTVGSGLELSQRLSEPVPKTQYGITSPTVPTPYPSLSDQKIHLFDIKHTFDNYRVWMKHEKMSRHRDLLAGKTSHGGVSLKTAEQIPSRSPRKTRPIRTLPVPTSISCRTFVDAPSSSNDHAVGALLHDLLPQVDTPKDETSPSSPTNNGEAQAEDSQQTLRKPNTIPSSDPNRLLEVTFDMGTVLGGMADFLQSTANILRKTADKTRETDTTPIGDLLSGFRDIVTEAAGMGMDLLQALEQKSATDAKQSATLLVEKQFIHPDLSDITFDDLIHVNNNEGVQQPLVESYRSSITSHLSLEDAISQSQSKLSVPHLDRNRPRNVESSSNALDHIISEVQTSMQTSGGQATASGLSQSALEPDFAARYPPITNWSNISSRQNTRETTNNFAHHTSLPGAWPDSKPSERPSLLPLATEPKYNSLSSISLSMGSSSFSPDRKPETPSIWSGSADANTSTPVYRTADLELGKSHLVTSDKNQGTNWIPIRSLSQTVQSNDSTGNRHSNPLFRRNLHLTSTPQEPFPPRRSWTVSHKPQSDRNTTFQQSELRQNINPPPLLPLLRRNLNSGFGPHQSLTPNLPGAFPDAQLPLVHELPIQPSQPPSHLRHSASLNFHPRGLPKPVPASIAPQPPQPPTSFLPGQNSIPHLPRVPFATHFSTVQPTSSGAGMTDLGTNNNRPYNRPPQPPVPRKSRALLRPKVRECIEQLQDMGYGSDNTHETKRLKMYADMANGDLGEAVDMIEEDRRMHSLYARESA